jgi:hypothetical protein
MFDPGLVLAIAITIGIALIMQVEALEIRGGELRRLGYR